MEDTSTQPSDPHNYSDILKSVQSAELIERVAYGVFGAVVLACLGVVFQSFGLIPLFVGVVASLVLGVSALVLIALHARAHGGFHNDELSEAYRWLMYSLALAGLLVGGSLLGFY